MRARALLGGLGDRQDACQLASEFDCNLAPGRDDPHLLDQTPDDVEGLPVVVGVTERRLQVLYSGAIDRGEVGVQERLVLGRSVERISPVVPSQPPAP